MVHNDNSLIYLKYNYFNRKRMLMSTDPIFGSVDIKAIEKKHWQIY